MAFLSNYKKQTIIYNGAALAVVLLLIKWVESRYLILGNQVEVFTGIIALVFTCLGVWLAIKLIPAKVIHTKEVEYLIANPENSIEKPVIETDLSNRELEVIQLMANGLSNQEIAAKLFVSLNTVKTHSSRIFFKLDVKRRTQAIDKARQMQIIA